MAKILVADDEAYIRRVISMWLSRHGHEIIEVDNGVSAFEAVENNEIDLIISDMNMPGMDGLRLAKAVREKGLGIPFMLLSARCDQDRLLERAKPYGVHLFPKPFLPSRLVVDIDRLLGTAAVWEQGS